MIPTFLEPQIMLLQNANLKTDYFFNLVLFLLLGLSSKEEKSIELFLMLFCLQGNRYHMELC